MAYSVSLSPVSPLFAMRQIVGITDVVQVALGHSHGCALSSTGRSRCWGANVAGQLGDGTTEPRLEPVAVVELDDAVELVAGGNHTCARSRGGHIQCWGELFIDRGECADGTITYGARPVRVYPRHLRRVTALASGVDHLCALVARQPLCWGVPSFGQLGDGPLVAPDADLNRAGVTNVASMGLFMERSMVVRRDGEVWAWGEVDAVDPHAVPGLRNVAQVAPGGDHACVRLADGSVWCWGLNGHGQLGDGTTTDREAPAQVADLSDVTSIAIGFDHSCALLSDSTVRCWGKNEHGQLGDGTTTSRTSPVEVAGLSEVAGIVSSFGSCAWLDDGTVRCWGPPAWEDTHY
jgi:alpha-tubulin suppressor-like RCC1 family protein